MPLFVALDLPRTTTITSYWHLVIDFFVQLQQKAYEIKEIKKNNIWCRMSASYELQRNQYVRNVQFIFRYFHTHNIGHWAFWSFLSAECVFVFVSLSDTRRFLSRDRVEYEEFVKQQWR